MGRKGEVRVDSRGRVSLESVRTQKHEWYMASEESDGTIILVPAALVPARRLTLPEPSLGMIEEKMT